MTQTAGFAANTGGPIISVVLGGTVIPLPNAQVLSPNIAANAANTVFTVADAGRYRVSYSVNTTLALLLGTRLTLNGSAITASTIAPLLSLSSFRNELILDIPANGQFSLEMYGLLGAATLISGAGATLMIVRLS